MRDSGKTIEPVVNHVIAEILRTKNPGWQDISAEQTSTLIEGSGLRPDILVPGRSPVVLETEYHPAPTVEEDAKAKLGKKLLISAQQIEQVIALRLPALLKTCPQSNLREEVSKAEYEWCLWSLSTPDKPVRWPPEGKGWLNGGIDALADTLEYAGLSERLVTESLDTLETDVAAAAEILRKDTLYHPDINLEIAKHLHQEDSEQTSRMAMVIVANALTFQTLISGSHKIKTIDQLRLRSGILSKGNILQEWQRILNEVNYWPIFHIAVEILRPVPSGLASRLLGLLAKTSDALAANEVTRSHDLYGRLFQQLISDRKFLATFYTLPPSATLLADLAVGSMNVDWGDADALKALRIADFACGTGTLLAAAYHSVLARYRRRGGDDSEIHKAMMEKSLIAADIMPAATHLTTSMLSSLHPTKIFHGTQVHTLPYGREGGDSYIYIGALDFIASEHGFDLFKKEIGLQVAEGKGPARFVKRKEVATKQFALRHETVDLVIMNPPFTRPAGQEGERIGVPIPAFAGFSTSEREKKDMAERLAILRKELDAPAGHGSAGLGSNFIDLADAKLRSGGTLALILPMSFAQGKAWENSRTFLGERYTDIRIISIATAKSHDKAFSADTGMGEVLILARKRETKRKGTVPDVHWITLRRRPVQAMEAIRIAREITMACKKKDSKRIEQRIEIGTDLAGTILPSSLKHGGCAAIADLSLARAAVALESGQVSLPRLGGEIELKTCQLKELGRAGIHHAGIRFYKKKVSPHAPFQIKPIEGVPTYPCLWAHNANKERKLGVAPDQQGVVRHGAQEKAERVWNTATRLHFSRDFQLNSQSLAACLTKERTIGGRAWPSFQMGFRGYEKVMVLWANTTLGLLLFWWTGSTQQAGRACLSISRLPDLHVLDVRCLTTHQIAASKKIFGDFKERDFLPANEAYRDPARQDLDRQILIGLLGLPEEIMNPLEKLREKWCAEPTVHGGKSTQFVPDTVS